MCTGLEIAAIVAATAGTAAQASAQQQQIKAQNNAALAELNRQKMLREKAGKVFDRAVDDIGPGTQMPALEEATQTRREAFDRSIFPTAGGSYELAGGGGPSLVDDAAGLKSLQLGGELSRKADARARLEGLGDLLLRNQLKSSQRGSEIGAIADASEGFARLLPGEMRAASEKGRGLATLGDLLVGVGGAGLKYAGSQPAAAGTPGTASSLPRAGSVDRIAPTSMYRVTNFDRSPFLGR